MSLKQFPGAGSGGGETEIVTGVSGDPVSVQNPFPSDGDSVYEKDVWPEESDTSGWTNESGTDLPENAFIPFNNLHTLLKNDSTDNPKSFLIHFQRTVKLQQIAFGCFDLLYNFSNIKITLRGSAGETRSIIDYSEDSVKRNSLDIPFEPEFANSILFEFFTSDPVGISNIVIQKASIVEATLRAQTDDGIIKNVQSSSRGNLKVALAEYQADAFGRLRVSEPFSIFDSSPTLDTYDLFWSDITNGTSTRVYDRNKSSQTMTVTDAAVQPGNALRLYQNGSALVPMSINTSDSHSILFWIRPQTNTQNTTVFNKNGIFQIDYSSGELNVNYFSIGNTTTSGANLSVDKWSRVVVTYEQSIGLKVYVDNVLVGQINSANGVGNNTNQLGLNPNNNNYVSFDEVCVFSSNIDISTIDSDWSNGDGRSYIGTEGGLSDLYKMEELSGTTIENSVSGGSSGTITGTEGVGFDWVIGKVGKIGVGDDYIISQTKQRFKYQPGKSTLVLITGEMSYEDNVVKRMGLVDYDNIDLPTIDFTPRNGVYVENCGQCVSWNIANNGVITETASQSTWNVDRLDGLGASGFTLDLSGTIISFLDYEWLGVGTVRPGFVIDGEIVVCHEFHHANTGNFNDVYMRTGNLPVSYAIRSTGGNGSMKQICSSVMSEGGFNPKGLLRGSSGNRDGVTVLSNSLETVLGIRLKNDSFEYSVEISQISVLAESSTDAYWMILYKPTLDGTQTWTDEGSTYQKSESNSDVIDEGVVIAQGTLSSDNDAVSPSIENVLKLGKDLDGGLDEIWLCVYNLGGATESFHGTLNIRELI